MTTGEVFVDTGVWVAISVSGDQYHRTASHHLRQLARERVPLVTTNLVAAEAYVLIFRAGGHSKALTFLRSLRESNRVLRIYSSPELEIRAEEILTRYSDHDFSFVDAVSFAVMHERDISAAFAFNRHFRTAGFALWPCDSSI